MHIFSIFMITVIDQLTCLSYSIASLHPCRKVVLALESRPEIPRRPLTSRRVRIHYLNPLIGVQCVRVVLF